MGNEPIHSRSDVYVADGLVFKKPLGNKQVLMEIVPAGGAAFGKSVFKHRIEFGEGEFLTRGGVLMMQSAIIAPKRG